MNDTYILVSEKEWHVALYEELRLKFSSDQWILIHSKKDFNVDNIRKIGPKQIFIPHWSYFIDEKIFNNFECIVFHMTDLPYGRGGSPLQNLIVRGHSSTKISALRVTKEIDAGDIYLKRKLNLNGTAFQIFKRSSKVIGKMIENIIVKGIRPSPQKGEIVKFERRLPHEGNLDGLSSLDSIYNHIRMLDCEGYPLAFLENQNIKYEFFNARYKNNELIANVRIIKK